MRPSEGAGRDDASAWPTRRAFRIPGARARAPREHPRAPLELRLPEDQKLSLAVIAGPDAGKMYAIEKPRIVIGREEVDFALDDPEISRQHAAIEVRGENAHVLDLSSTNGTFVGRNAIREAPLANQQEFTIGGSTMMLIVTRP